MPMDKVNSNDPLFIPALRIMSKCLADRLDTQLTVKMYIRSAHDQGRFTNL